MYFPGEVVYEDGSVENALGGYGLPHEPSGPRWLRNLLGNDFFTSVYCADFNPRGFVVNFPHPTDSDLALLDVESSQTLAAEQPQYTDVKIIAKQSSKPRADQMAHGGVRSRRAHLQPGVRLCRKIHDSLPLPTHVALVLSHSPQRSRGQDEQHVAGLNWNQRGRIRFLAGFRFALSPIGIRLTSHSASLRKSRVD